MEIDKNLLNQALSSEPERIETLAKEIARIMGVSEEKALSIARNGDLIKSRLQRMNDQDLQNAAAILGEDKAAQIMKLLKGNGNG